MSIPRLTNFIAGEAAGPASGAYFEKLAPATGEVLAEVPDSAGEDLARAVATADAAAPWWGARTPRERSLVLLSLASQLEARAADFIEAASRDQGLPIARARELELPAALRFLREQATRILHASDEASASGNDGALHYSVRRPLGAVGVAARGGLSLPALLRCLAPALAAGNTVVATPDPAAPLTAQLLAGLLNEAGVAPGTVNFVFSARGPAFLAGAPGLRACFGAEAEPGPADQTFFVYEDADLAEACLAAVRAAFTREVAERRGFLHVYVHEEILGSFTEKFKRTMGLLRLGAPWERDVQVGPLPSAAARARFHAGLQAAQARGAELRAGGAEPALHEELRRGFYAAPALLLGGAAHGLSPGEEAYGPAAWIHPLSGFSPPASAPSGEVWAWTKSLARAHRLAAELSAASLGINGAPASTFLKSPGINAFTRTLLVRVKI